MPDRPNKWNNQTSKNHAPWYIIPADNKPAARFIVASILLQELKKYKNIREPELAPKIEANITEYKKQLENE